MVHTFSLWLPMPEAGLRAADLERLLAETLAGRPLRWAITACEGHRILIEGAVLR